jgi:hypothetical protein
MEQLDLEALIGKADRDLLVQGMQALHSQRLAAWHAQNAFANRVGQPAIDQASFGLDEAAQMLRRLGAAPSVL